MFGGNIRAKFLIQWLACSMAGKKMIYCPFGSGGYLQNKALLNRYSKMMVGEVYESLIKAGESAFNPGFDLYKNLCSLVL